MKIKKECCHQSNGATGMKQLTLPTHCCCNHRTAIKNNINMAIVTRVALDKMTRVGGGRLRGQSRLRVTIVFNGQQYKKEKLSPYLHL
jgi:hypothetical protein